jgi:hypothetical protein
MVSNKKFSNVQQRYVVQVSDTTMFNRIPDVCPTEK